VTLWGIDYQDLQLPFINMRMYDGIWITDSDDDMGTQPNPQLVNYSITWNDTADRYDLGGGYSGWYITDVRALKPAPETYWRYEFQYDYANSDDYYLGYVYANARRGTLTGRSLKCWTRAGALADTPSLMRPGSKW